MTAKKTTKKIGRPTLYRPEMCEKMEEYFNRDLFKVINVQKMAPTGEVVDTTVVVPNDFPSFEEFAVNHLGVSTDAFQDWKKKHEEFGVSYKRCLNIQKKFLLNHGLSGGYASNFAKFVSINVTDFVDRSEVKTDNEHNVKGYGVAFDLTKKPEEI